MRILNLKPFVAAALTAVVGWFGHESRAADPLIPNAATMLEYLQSRVRAPALHVGPFDIHPRGSMSVSYDDNILLSPDKPQADVIWTFSPGVSAVADNTTGGYGTSLTLGYDLSVVDFRHYSNNSSVDHRANLVAKWLMAKLSLELNQTFQRASTGLVEVGDRLRQTLSGTQLTAHYRLSELTSFDLSPRVTTSETAGLTGSTDWGGDAFFNHMVGAKVGVGIGASGGYIDVSDSPHQTYERALLRLTYAATGKLDFEANAGGEWRQYEGLPGTVIPVLGVAAAYRPTEATSVTLEAHRRETVSLFQGQDYVTAGVSMGISRRLVERCQVSLSGTYENRDYKQADPAASAKRQDDFYLLRVGIAVTLLKQWTADGFYQYERNSSSETGGELEDNQVLLRTSVKF